MDDWFKKPNKPLTTDRTWNDGKSIDSRPPQKWISNINKASQPPRTFDELMSTPIDFSAYVMHNLKIDNLTQEILNNPEGHEYPFDLSGSSSTKYKTSTNKTKAAKYDNIEGIEDMVLMLWSPVKVAYDKFDMLVTHVKAMKWYDYGYLEEIISRREDQTLHKFKEGDFPRLNLHDIEDLLLLLV
uniref:Uncharacterized protein n=1 Tax=Tanacetum cinerariifolium TaxID=118510 RepID=A0A699HV40_TANCI|nr:hypothetical protein [Tanacetum cinerariifolium]